MNKERYNRLMKSVVAKFNDLSVLIGDLSLIAICKNEIDESISDYLEMIEQKLNHTYSEIINLKTLIERKTK